MSPALGRSSLAIFVAMIVTGVAEAGTSCFGLACNARPQNGKRRWRLPERSPASGAQRKVGRIVELGDHRLSRANRVRYSTPIDSSVACVHCPPLARTLWIRMRASTSCNETCSAPTEVASCIHSVHTVLGTPWRFSDADAWSQNGASRAAVHLLTQLGMLRAQADAKGQHLCEEHKAFS